MENIFRKARGSAAAKRNYNHTKSILQKTARAKVVLENQALRAERTALDQLRLLDIRLGPGVGAVKERRRLAEILARQG